MPAEPPLVAALEATCLVLRWEGPQRLRIGPPVRGISDYPVFDDPAVPVSSDVPACICFRSIPTLYYTMTERRLVECACLCMRRPGSANCLHMGFVLADRTHKTLWKHTPRTPSYSVTLQLRSPRFRQGILPKCRPCFRDALTATDVTITVLVTHESHCVKVAQTAENECVKYSSSALPVQTVRTLYKGP